MWQALVLLEYRAYLVTRMVHASLQELTQQRTLLGQTTYAKLKDLASPMPVSELTLDDTMTHLEGHKQ